MVLSNFNCNHVETASPYKLFSGILQGIFVFTTVYHNTIDYTWYNICIAWFLDIRISTFFCSQMDYFVETINETMLPFGNITDVGGNYTITILVNGTPTTLKYVNDPSLFAVRTCQSYFQPQETIQYSNIGPFIEGMSAGATEKEDFIITPDLRGKVYMSIPL